MTKWIAAVTLVVMLVACGADDPPEPYCSTDLDPRPYPTCSDDPDLTNEHVIERCEAGEPVWMPACDARSLANVSCETGSVACAGDFAAREPFCRDICPDVPRSAP